MKKERDINAYSSDGRIYQLEYAMKAASLGTTTIGIKVKEGVVVVSEKKLVTSLQVPDSVKKHHKLYKHCGFAFSGLSGDARTIIKKARDSALHHHFVYNEKIPVEGIVKGLAEISLNFGEKEEAMKIFSRPFGISVLVAGYDTKSRLFSLDPSGTYMEYSAKAIGSAAEAVTTSLVNQYRENSTIDEAIRTSLSLLKSVMKDPITENNCEIMVCLEKDVSFLDKLEIHEYLSTLTSAD